MSFQGLFHRLLLAASCLLLLLLLLLLLATRLTTRTELGPSVG